MTDKSRHWTQVFFLASDKVGYPNSKERQAYSGQARRYGAELERCGIVSRQVVGEVEFAADAEDDQVCKIKVREKYIVPNKYIQLLMVRRASKVTIVINDH